MQRTRKLNAYEVKLIKDYKLQADEVRGRTQIFDQATLVAAHKQEVAKKEVAVQVQIKSDSEYFTSQEFRDDVMLELMEAGASELQATNRTRDQARLFAEARELGMM